MENDTVGSLSLLYRCQKKSNLFQSIQFNDGIKDVTPPGQDRRFVLLSGFPDDIKITTYNSSAFAFIAQLCKFCKEILFIFHLSWSINNYQVPSAKDKNTTMKCCGVKLVMLNKIILDVSMNIIGKLSNRRDTLHRFSRTDLP
jgi:hypothetical protein